MTVSRDDLRANLGNHWDVEGIATTDYATVLTREAIEEIGPDRMREMGMLIDLPALRTDERDRALGRVWHLRARRR